MDRQQNIFVSCVSPNDPRVALLLGALRAWGLSYATSAQQSPTGELGNLSEMTQQAIAMCDVFLRVCTQATKRSYWMSLEAGAFLGVQSDDHRRGEPGRHR